MTRLQRLGVHLTLIVLGISCLLPLVWMISTSLKSDDQVYAQQGATQQAFSIATLLPRPVNWSNYPKALDTVPFEMYLRNTLLLCTLTVFGVVVSSAIVAYGFARIDFKGRNFWFMLMIATMALPAQVTMVPVFATFRALGWY